MSTFQQRRCAHCKSRNMHDLNRLPRAPLVPYREYDAPGRGSFTDDLLPTPEERLLTPPRAGAP